MIDSGEVPAGRLARARAGEEAALRAIGGSLPSASLAGLRVPPLPDVRPLADDQSARRPRSSSCVRARRTRAGKDAAPRPALGAVQPDLAEPEARGARRRRRGVLGTRGRRLRRAAEVDRARLDARRLVRGASTITQQLAKNLYLSPSSNPMRKFRELIIARRLEAELEQGADPRDLPERDRMGRRHLRRRGGRAHLLWRAGGGARAVAGGAARRRDHQPAPAEPGRPTPRLLRRQQMILRRMGGVTPPEPAEPLAPPLEAVRAAAWPDRSRPTTSAAAADRYRSAARPEQYKIRAHWRLSLTLLSSSLHLEALAALH